jgi:signal transduction histidine kinase
MKPEPSLERNGFGRADLMTLHQFLTLNRDELIARTRAKVAQRPWPAVSASELESGIPLFLTQLAETLRLENTDVPFSASAIGSSATKHGGHLLARGFTVSQVVHDYGDVCQAITELAVERKATISVEEFHTLNRCLDTAMAEAVTEHGRMQQATSQDEAEQRGYLAHELRNKLQTALLAFQMLKAGKVAIGGSTGAVLGHSLADLREIIDTGLSEIRLESGTERHDRVLLPDFMDDLAVAAKLHAEYHNIQLNVERVDPTLAVTADPQLLASAVMNLLQNAFKFTHAHGVVTVRVRADNGRVLIDVEDECGGFTEGEADVSLPFGDRRKQHRSGLGLGLSISRRAVKASGGEIRTRNVPSKGCVFSIDLPSA